VARPEKPTARPAKAAKPGKPAFPKKNQPPSDAEVAARLPLPLGRKLEALRRFLTKQKGLEEGWHFYGPKAGWAYRYLRGEETVTTIVLHDGIPTAVLALDADIQKAVDWGALSAVAQRAKKVAHGTPALLWLDLPLDGEGGQDLKALIKAKLAAPRGAGTKAPPKARAARTPDDADADEDPGESED